MYRLFALITLLLFVQADPKSPKIYNILISSKKNLSPSHALPVYEPVLRTVALPTFYYNTPISYHPISTINPNFVFNAEPQINEGNEPLPIQQFIPYGYSSEVWPNFQQKPKIQTEQKNDQKTTEDPRQIIANLKRNPEIPDVPPPPLPTKN